ncbi:MAG: aminotransferase class III-fold pyridoxal phosphate-dependent enzyme, partial [Legionellaceae bacterium]
HTSNTYHILNQEKLARRLTALSCMEQVFFANSGAEANEAALKVARLFGHKKGIECPKVVVMSDAFHGRTMATLSASGGKKVQEGFEPLVSGFIRVPFNDVPALKTAALSHPDIVAVLVEPIQGEGGIVIPDSSYLEQVSSLCKAHNWLLMLDEVQTGNGRTGHFFEFMSHGIQPDVVTTAKGLGNGIPIGACLMSQEACNLFKPGNHGSTFGGNPFACATALTVLDVIEREGLCERAALQGERLKKGLTKALHKNSAVLDIRGKGLMLGITLDRPALEMRLIGLENKLLFGVTAETIIRLLPPLIISEDEVDELIVRLVKTIETFVHT